MISPSDLTAAGWTQDTRAGVTDFWDKGILSFYQPKGDVIYTGREPYIEVATGVTEMTELARLATWKPPEPRTSPRKGGRGI